MNPLFGLLAAATSVFALASAAQAQNADASVALSGTIGSRAIVTVGSNPPKTLAVGQSYQGVKLVSVGNDQAVVDVQGKRQSLRVGEAPLSVGNAASSAGRGSKIVLTAGSGGHFLSQGNINGKAVQFMVDTGATTIAMGASEAERVGLNYKNGIPVRTSTANGIANGYKLNLDSVRIGEVEIYGVEAIVTPQSMPFVLLGNSFLSRFQMKRENEIMTLERRY